MDIRSPDLKEELTGGVYLAYQDTNPFGSPLALYLIAEEPTSKTLVKLAGEVTINQETGQLISTFKNTPQAPFESLTLHLWNGPRSSQATPARCGSYPAVGTFTSELDPNEATAPVVSESPIEITSGPGGSPCPGGALPFTPSVQAGPTNTQAAADTPFTLNIGRPDGDASDRIGDDETAAGRRRADLAGPSVQRTAEAEADACQASKAKSGTRRASPGSERSPVTLNGSLYLTGPLTRDAHHGSGPFGLLGQDARARRPVRTRLCQRVLDDQHRTPKPPPRPSPVRQMPDMLKGVPVQLKALT